MSGITTTGKTTLIFNISAGSKPGHSIDATVEIQENKVGSEISSVKMSPGSHVAHQDTPSASGAKQSAVQEAMVRVRVNTGNNAAKEVKLLKI